MKKICIVTFHNAHNYGAVLQAFALCKKLKKINKNNDIKIINYKNKNIMTLESISKYNLQNVNQCELNENVGFNMDKAARFIEFQSPDIIYMEGVKTKESFDYFSSLVFDNKTIIMEFLANNMEDLRNKLAFSDFETLKSLISCMIFIHSKDSIEVFDKETIQKYLA